YVPGRRFVNSNEPSAATAAVTDVTPGPPRPPATPWPVIRICVMGRAAAPGAATVWPALSCRMILPPNRTAWATASRKSRPGRVAVGATVTEVAPDDAATPGK